MPALPDMDRKFAELAKDTDRHRPAAVVPRSNAGRRIHMSDVFDTVATFRLPGKGKATVTFEGEPHPSRPIELSEDERLAIEDLLIDIASRRQGGRHG